MPAGNIYVGGERHDNFVRFKVDQIARTLPGPIIREWWVNMLDGLVAPYVKDRGFDWEISVEENKAIPYGQADKLPASMALTAPGVSG